MGSYVPNTAKERQEMLSTMGMTSMDQLFQSIPDEVKLKRSFRSPRERQNLRCVVKWKEWLEGTGSSSLYSGEPAHTGILFRRS